MVLPCSALSTTAMRLECSRINAWQLEHDAHARADRGQLPGLEGAMGGTDGGVDFSGGGKRHLGQHLLGRRVDDVVPLGGLRFDPLAVDQQLDLLDQWFRWA